MRVFRLSPMVILLMALFKVSNAWAISIENMGPIENPPSSRDAGFSIVTLKNFGCPIEPSYNQLMHLTPHEGKLNSESDIPYQPLSDIWSGLKFGHTCYLLFTIHLHAKDNKGQQIAGNCHLTLSVNGTETADALKFTLAKNLSSCTSPLVFSYKGPFSALFQIKQETVHKRTQPA